MNNTTKRLEDTIDNEMAYLWSAIEENLPKSQEMEALGQEKIFRAVKAGYISYRPIFITQAIAEERERVRAKTKGVRDSLLVYFHNAVNDQKAPYRHAIQAIEEEILASLDTNPK